MNEAWKKGFLFYHFYYIIDEGYFTIIKFRQIENQNAQLRDFINLYLSLCMRKPTKCFGENKGADQLRSNCEADQRLCFRYMDSTIPLLSKSKNFQPLTIFCDCTALFVSDLVGNPNCWFSHAQAHLPLEFRGF